MIYIVILYGSYLGKIDLDTISLNHIIGSLEIINQFTLELFLHGLFHILPDFFESLAVKVLGLHETKTIFLFGG